MIKVCYFFLKEFRVILLWIYFKGIWNPGLGRYNKFNEEIIVPVIENTCFESELEGSLRVAMHKYPNTRYLIFLAFLIAKRPIK